VIPAQDHAAVQQCVNLLPSAQQKKITICNGGDCRAGSVRAGIHASSPQIEWIAVHDAARPLISADVIDRTLSAAVAHGAAGAALAVHLTIKQATGPLPARVDHTVPRQNLWAMQTPQIARRADFLKCFADCPIPLTDVTDDMQLLELCGLPVWLVEGEERNLKITTPIDLQIAESLLKS
jgi:2-C-methyl-D-erythritol 4-phosphate cytidylyltransferase